uniref:DUF6538 domain-containing protein n=1 Tax=Hyphomicrobium sp. ghe19 TaxID=2682968 RepID=UPI00403F392C
MKPVSQTLHLQKRGDVYHYFRRVPKHLVPIIGKSFLKRSRRPEGGRAFCRRGKGIDCPTPWECLKAQPATDLDAHRTPASNDRTARQTVG